MKLTVVSICKNEAATITELIDRIPKKIKGITKVDVVVMNDGSTDDTAAIAKQAGATVLGDDHSRGLAYRFREMVDYALEQGTDILVNIDGDLQFLPEEIPFLVAPIVEGKADFVASDRFSDPKTGKVRRPENMPPAKYYGNKLGAKIVSNLSKRTFNDVTCGFRAYNQKALIALNINTKHTYTQESFQVLAAKHMRIVTVPTTVKYYPDRKSRVVTSVPKYMLTSAVNILRAFRDFAPLRFFITLGLVPFVLGAICLGFFIGHYLVTSQFSPYKAVGFTGVYLVSLALFLWGLGLMADMLARVLNNQEKIYEHLRRNALKK